jgi:endonuclease/exonuclease/phosphatase family metal-dependent hydrolase
MSIHAWLAAALLLVATAACGGVPAAPADAPAPAGSAAAGGNSIRVLSYNIHAGTDWEGKPALAWIGAVLDSIDADVVLLQEVDRRTRRSAGVDHLAELQRMTGRHGVFGRSLFFQDGEYGIALLSRWPILRDTTVHLTVVPPQDRSGSVTEPRVALHAVIDAPGGPLHVINTHVDPSGVPTYRRQELIALMAHAARAVPRDADLIVGGDLNARPATDDVTAFRLAFHDAWTACGDGGPGYTFPAHAADRRIDYILYRSGRCRSAAVIPTLASDHLPLLVLWERR